MIWLEGQPSLSNWLRHTKYVSWWWTCCWQHSHSLNRACPSSWPGWKAAKKWLVAHFRQVCMVQWREWFDMWSYSLGRKNSHHTGHQMKYNTACFSGRGIVCNSVNCCDHYLLVIIFQPGNLTCVCVCVCICVWACECADYSKGQWDKGKCFWTVFLCLSLQNVSLKSFRVSRHCPGYMDSLRSFTTC